MKKIPVIAVVGPTASGKSALAVEIALAIGGEVISADSMQIYKGPAVATAQPSEEEMKGVVHRMLGFIPVTEAYSVAAYVRDAEKEIEKTVSAGKIPVVCGGTGLYIDGLLGNMRYDDAPDTSALRAELNDRCEREGIEKLFSELSSADPAYAATLHINNKVRIIRALEIYRSTGRIPSEVRAGALGKQSGYRTLFIGLDYSDRNILYDRIDRRVDLMAENGLVEEAEKFLPLVGKTAVQAIGHKELIPYFEGECTLEEALGSLKKSTRHYAKRQLTWFRRNAGINWIYPDITGFDGAVGAAIALSEDFLRKE